MVDRCQHDSSAKGWLISVSPGLVRVLWLIVIVFSAGLDSCRKAEGPGSSRVAVDSLPIIKAAPAFKGMDQNGNEVQGSQLAGSIWVASFMFTSCQGVCPIMNGTLRDVQEMIKDPDLRFVSFTVDPETDSREVLAEYGRRYEADDKRWIFVRMDRDSVRKLSKDGFLLSDPFEPAAHSSRYVLVDSRNNIRGYYDCLDSSKVAEMKRDIAVLRSAGVR